MTGGGSARTGSVGAAALAAVAVAALGAAGHVFLAGVLATTTGLLALAAVVAWMVGAAVSRIAGGRLERRGRIGLALAAVVLGLVAGSIGTWLYARGEGGVLGPVDYLVETFGLIIPAEFLIATVVAAWSAR